MKRLYDIVCATRRPTPAEHVGPVSLGFLLGLVRASPQGGVPLQLRTTFPPVEEDDLGAPELNADLGDLSLFHLNKNGQLLKARALEKLFPVA